VSTRRERVSRPDGRVLDSARTRVVTRVLDDNELRARPRAMQRPRRAQRRLEVEPAVHDHTRNPAHPVRVPKEGPVLDPRIVPDVVRDDPGERERERRVAERRELGRHSPGSSPTRQPGGPKRPVAGPRADHGLRRRLSTFSSTLYAAVAAAASFEYPGHRRRRAEVGLVPSVGRVDGIVQSSVDHRLMQYMHEQRWGGCRQRRPGSLVPVDHDVLGRRVGGTSRRGHHERADERASGSNTQF
jgi:hypothetical protein